MQQACLQPFDNLRRAFLCAGGLGAGEAALAALAATGNYLNSDSAASSAESDEAARVSHRLGSGCSSARAWSGSRSSEPVHDPSTRSRSSLPQTRLHPRHRHRAIGISVCLGFFAPSSDSSFAQDLCVVGFPPSESSFVCVSPSCGAGLSPEPGSSIRVINRNSFDLTSIEFIHPAPFRISECSIAP
ncbi:hypothetical protein O181_058585 [Austropuccinia psidii MF-1]|uniref:Uncharacterized protein n=1 Tax=Austropuccinia psidii MF-1 TaxID=1389203 RepID=A0A9Q3EGT5_9BASI|nr:hypothetical protein [Austropuccinia psidii MF-1]